MKTYSEEIKNNFSKWIKAIDSEPSESYDPKYKSWKSKEKRCGNNFESACKSEGLNYLEVYKELLGNNPMVINQY